MKGPDSAPAIKADLKLLRKELGSELRGELKLVRDELRGEIDLARGESRGAFAELDQKIGRVAVELVRAQADVREIKTVMATKIDIDRVLTAIDAFAGKSQNYDRAATLHGQVLTEGQVALKDH